MTTDNNINTSINIKKTPLYEEHIKLGAKMVAFAGFYMPLYYKSIIEEHLNVRNYSGLFDISHMGEILVTGTQAGLFLDYVLTADIANAKPNAITYSLMLNENGGIIDDITVYKFSEAVYMVVANAANTEKDFSWLHLQNMDFQKANFDEKFYDVHVENISDKIGLVSIQGPKSRDVIYPFTDNVTKIIHNEFLQKEALQSRDNLTAVNASASEGLNPEGLNLCNFFNLDIGLKPLNELKHFEFTCVKFKDINVEAVISRSGYTGEFGFEIFVSADDTKHLWNYILKNAPASNADSAFVHNLKIVPVGLGARDTLRFEAALPLYGNELDETITPYDAGLEKFLSQTKYFIGKEALEKVKNKEKRLIFFKLSGKQIPRHLQKILDENLKPIGCVASGTYSPINRAPIGSAYISDVNISPPSLKNFFIDIRGNFEKADVVSPPFHHKK